MINFNSTPVPSNRLKKSPIFTLKIVRADVGPNGLPANMLQHNLTAHINIYSEADATPPFLQEIIREEMDCDDLIFLGSNGFLFHEQESTSGNYLLSLRYDFSKSEITW